MSVATQNEINIKASRVDILREVLKSSARDRVVETLAKGALENLPFIQSVPDCVKVRCRKSRLYLSGCLPSFYLKQLAQETLRQLCGNQMEIVNAIDVASHRGPEPGKVPNNRLAKSGRSKVW